MTERFHWMTPAAMGAVIGVVLALSSCASDADNADTYRTSPEYSGTGVEPAKSGLGITLFGEDDKEGRTGAVAVNAFLWRASLDTIAFMPLASADPFGGVIISDWYAPPETPDERFKVNVYILGRTLRADGLKVSVFRQTNDGSGNWSDAAVGADVAKEFENAVLSRARQLRLQAVSENG
ncbi:MAG: DUF3576 domain-containing protein [Rhodospirillaceae bacterium]|nr:DUF3576 domain-containing protein [Rhodospirillaceae bacterium]